MQYVCMHVKKVLSCTKVESVLLHNPRPAVDLLNCSRPWVMLQQQAMSVCYSNI